MADQNSMETQPPQDPPKESTEGSRDRDRDRDRRSDRDRERRSDRDRDRTRDRRSDRRDRDRDRDRDRERRRDRSASPKRDRSRDRSRRNRSSERRRERDEFDPPTREEEATKNRDDYTIFVHQIHPKVDDRDLFDFFSHVGRVLDIRLIRDQRTLKSKGLAYIEFWQQDSTTKAIALNGCELGGYPISVSQAQTDTSGSSELPDIPMRLYVGSVHPDVAEDDLKQIFEAFGPLMGVQLGKDASGENQHAYVTYKKETDAKQALGALNGLEIAGRAIKVGVVDMAQQGFNLDSAGELDDSYGGLNMTAQGRQALMAKLGRGTITGIAPPPNMAAPVQTGGSGIMSAQSLAVPLIQPTTCLVIKNMFDPATETDPEFHLDIQEDIEEEVEKLGIKLSHIHVDKKHPSGHVFLRLDSIEKSKTVAKSFHGRWFASRQITAEFVPETTYFSRFPKE